MAAKITETPVGIVVDLGQPVDGLQIHEAVFAIKNPIGYFDPDRELVQWEGGFSVKNGDHILHAGDATKQIYPGRTYQVLYVEYQKSGGMQMSQPTAAMLKGWAFDLATELLRKLGLSER